MDFTARDVQYLSFDGAMASRMSFAPRGPGEDEGWLMGSVFQTKHQRSRFVIADAQRFDGGPVASIWIPDQYVPIGTRGGWFPE